MKTLRNVFFFVLGFAGIAATGSSWIPPRPVPTVSEKLIRYAEAADEFDGLAIGSSLTYRQILPEIVEDASREAGRPLRLYNLGIDGMRPPEDTFVLERALAAQRSRPLEVVLVECNRIRFHIRPQDANTVRSIYWHDGKRLATLVRFAWMSDPSGLAVTLPTLWRHFAYGFRNLAALGRGHEALMASLLESGPSPRSLSADGYDPPPPRDRFSPDERSRFEQAVARLRSGERVAGPGDRVSEAELLEKRRIIERAGARMLLVVPPDPMARPLLSENDALRADTLDFSDPKEFAELFDPDERRDPAHLDIRGAERFSRLLARRVVARLGRRP